MTVVLLAVTGSRARGLDWTQADVDEGFALKVSDLDVQGVAVYSPLADWSSNRPSEHFESKTVCPEAEDGLVWEVRAFFKQVLNGSPEMLEVLFSPKVVYANELGNMLRQNAHYFTSKHVARRLFEGGKGLMHGAHKHYVSGGTLNVNYESYKQATDAVRRLLVAQRMLAYVVDGSGEFSVNLGAFQTSILRNWRCGVSFNGRHVSGADYWEEVDAQHAAVKSTVEKLLVDSGLRDVADAAALNKVLETCAAAGLAEDGWVKRHLK